MVVTYTSRWAFNFFITNAYSFKRKIFAKRTQLLKSISQYTSYSLIFNLRITQCYKTKNSIQSFSKINPDYEIQEMFNHLNTHHSYQLKSGYFAPLRHYTSLV